MGASRRLLATHQTKSVAAAWLAFREWLAFRQCLALSVVAASALCASPAWSVDRVAKSNRPPAAYYSLPRCGAPAVFAQIAAEYRGRHGVPDFTAVGIRARETPIREYWPLTDMPRRFCEGIITPPSGAEHPSFHPSNYPIYYAIIANGPGYELEWCVVGLDRPWPMDQRCRLARP